MKACKVILFSLILLISLLTVSYFYLVYKNNIDVPAPEKLEIQQALNRSINWVLNNKNDLININNPVLWWFLDESAYLTNNHKLSSLVRRYRNTTLDRNSVWTGYWINHPPFAYIPGSLDHMEKYQMFFVYALTCDEDLGQENVIQEQFDINYCDWRPYYSSCITHQMAAIRLLQIKGCGEQNEINDLSIKLADLIEKQLAWDPRIGDVYIQRTLMLLESGNHDKVKHIWLHNILNEQLDDGGWASFGKIMPLYNDKYLGFN